MHDLQTDGLALRVWISSAGGNRFVLVEDETGIDWPMLAQRACAVYATDGLVRISPVGARLEVQFWNPDGSADFCGNGLCCAGFLIAQRAGCVDSHLEILSDRVIRTVTLPIVRSADDRGQVCLRLPPAMLEPSQIPTTLRSGSDRVLNCPIEVDGVWLHVSTVFTGTPHCIIQSSSLPSDEEFRRIGPAMETHSAFPERISVIWSVPVDQNTVRIRIWERGVGETAACGTGACATVIVGRLLGSTRDVVMVKSAGGHCVVRCEPDLSTELEVEVHLSGGDTVNFYRLSPGGA